MSGRDYLKRIKAKLELGQPQWKAGATLLAEYGYSRRRETAIDTINEDLKRLDLRTEPPINSNMPLDVPRIHFSLQGNSAAKNNNIVSAKDTKEVETWHEPLGEGEIEELAVVPGFKVGELASAKKEVACIKPTETVSKAYTIMNLRKYSQLVVADSDRPQATAIKGIISYQSITDALLHNRQVEIVNLSLDKTTPQVSTEDDINAVVRHLSEHDVVLVIGVDKRLSGIITAWDLADEFGKVVGPFRWIEEIEERLRNLLEKKIGTTEVVGFLSSIEGAQQPIKSKKFTIGDLLRVIENNSNWDKLGLPHDRGEFSRGLDEIRELRNRLMHFGDDLTDKETQQIKRFCSMVRKIPLTEPSE